MRAMINCSPEQCRAVDAMLQSVGLEATIPVPTITIDVGAFNKRIADLERENDVQLRIIKEYQADSGLLKQILERM